MSIVIAAEPLPVRGSPHVPWPTVALLAAGMAYADGYWMISVRGAVGAVQRAQGPFAVWWRESTFSLPFFAFAVLGAMTLALRLFGSRLRRRWGAAGTLVLVVTAGTLAGLTEIVASSVYDYRLQTGELRMMDAMHSVCVRTCLRQELHATLAVHIQAALFAARALLITNLVLVGWLVAMSGGRLRTSSPVRQRAVARDRMWVGFGNQAADVRLVAVAGLLGAAAIHAAVMPEHFSEWAAAGAFFLLLVIAETAAAVALLLTGRRAPGSDRALMWLTAAVSIGPLLIWLGSRTVGLPIGPQSSRPEAVGIPDLAACLLEVVTLVAAIVLARHGDRLQRRASTSPYLRGLTVLALASVMVVGLTFTGPGSSWLGDFSVDGHRMHDVAVR